MLSAEYNMINGRHQMLCSSLFDTRSGQRDALALDVVGLDAAERRFPFSAAGHGISFPSWFWVASTDATLPSVETGVASGKQNRCEWCGRRPRSGRATVVSILLAAREGSALSNGPRPRPYMCRVRGRHPDGPRRTAARCAPRIAPGQSPARGGLDTPLRSAKNSIVVFCRLHHNQRCGLFKQFPCFVGGISLQLHHGVAPRLHSDASRSSPMQPLDQDNRERCERQGANGGNDLNCPARCENHAGRRLSLSELNRIGREGRKEFGSPVPGQMHAQALHGDLLPSIDSDR